MDLCEVTRLKICSKIITDCVSHNLILVYIIMVNNYISYFMINYIFVYKMPVKTYMQQESNYFRGLQK